MVATVLSGKELALEVRAGLKRKVEQIQNNDPNFKPGLVIVQVGGREDSNVYIRMKLKAAEEIGFQTIKSSVLIIFSFGSVLIIFFLFRDFRLLLEVGQRYNPVGAAHQDNESERGPFRTWNHSSDALGF
jgi:hypothetical protein